MQDLIDWINGELNSRGWSLRELARRADINPGSLSLVLNEQRGAGPEFCKSMARALNVSPEFVFRLAGLLPQVTTDEEMRREILHYYNQMPPDVQEHFRVLARALAEATAEPARGENEVGGQVAAAA